MFEWELIIQIDLRKDACCRPVTDNWLFCIYKRKHSLVMNGEFLCILKFLYIFVIQLAEEYHVYPTAIHFERIKI